MPARQRSASRPEPDPPGREVRVHAAIEDAGGLAPFVGSLLTPIARVVPKHIKAEAFLGMALATVNRDDKLRRAAQLNPASLVQALRLCAYLGHMPVRGAFALVPFNNHKATGGCEVVGIEEYRGVIERMYRAGGVVMVDAEVVRANDEFRREREGLPWHVYDPHADAAERGMLVGVYAWARLHTGNLSKVVWLNRAEVRKHRDVSRSGDAFWGPWDPADGPEKPWAPDMWLKTGLHALERWVPTSAEYRWEVGAAAAAAVAPAGFPLDVADRPLRSPVGDDAPDPGAEVLDAEILDEAPAEGAAGGAGDWPKVAAPGGTE